MSDIISLDEIRQRRAGAVSEAPAPAPCKPRELQAIATGKATIALDIPIEGGDVLELIVHPAWARKLAAMLVAAVKATEQWHLDRCRACNKKGCHELHPGRIFRGYHKGELITAFVERRTRRSWKLVTTPGGEAFYTTSWRWGNPVGWLDIASALPPTEEPPQ
jgi:hypothetical protein